MYSNSQIQKQHIEMKNILFYLFIVIALALTIFTVIRLAKSSDTRKIDPDEIASFLTTNISYIQETPLPEACILKDIKGSKFQVKDIFKNNKLVLRFTENCCDLCISTQVQQIKETFKDKIADYAIALVSCENVRLLRLLKDKFDINFPIYLIERNDAYIFLPDALELLNVPYSFIIYNDLKPSFIFVPSMEFTNISKKIYIEQFKAICHISSSLVINPFKEQIKNFGSIPYQEEYKFHFEYSNEQREPLIIKNIKTTCGCTIVEWDKQPLLPGQKASLTVKLKPENPGAYFKKIFVYINNVNPIVLGLKGFITE